MFLPTNNIVTQGEKTPGNEAFSAEKIVAAPNHREPV